MSVFMTSVSLLLLGSGIFYLYKLKFFYLLHPIRTMRLMFSERPKDGISPLKALLLALAGTLGVGNIAGVATALYHGGAGAVFWMIFSALIAMVLKYAEILLAMRHRRFDGKNSSEGGATYYIKDAFAGLGQKKLGNCIAAVFGILCLINTFTMGSMLQSNAVAGAVNQAFHIPSWITGTGVAILSIFVLKGGARRISSVTEKLVPLMSIIFLILCFSVLLLRHDRILGAVNAIFSQAFDFSSISGGVLGFLTSKAIRYGVMRGLISNEAGAGTAPMAHVTAATNRPAAQGIMGLVEVFVDTVLMCTVTALTILVSDGHLFAYGEDGIMIAQSAFTSVLGDVAGDIFGITVFFFGVATVLCWSHYGITALRALCSHAKSSKFWESLFSVFFALSVVVGAVSAPAWIWKTADLSIGVMTLINLVMLLMMHKEVVKETSMEMDIKETPVSLSFEKTHKLECKPQTRKEGH